MVRYRLTAQSHVIMRSRSSVHPIEWRAKALTGYLDAERREEGLAPGASGRLEISVRDLVSGNKAYDFQLPRTVNARKYPLVVAEVSSIEAGGEGHEARGSVTFYGSTIAADCPIEVSFVDDRIVLSGSTSLDLRSFGFNPPKVLGLRVYPDVEIDFSMTGRPEEA